VMATGAGGQVGCGTLDPISTASWLPRAAEMEKPVRGKREVRYIVARLDDPGNPQGKREELGCFPFLDLAKREADRFGPGICVDAEGGTYSTDGLHSRHTQWQTDWTNLDIYRGRKRRRPAADLYD
jgi:hypothetical protein